MSETKGRAAEGSDAPERHDGSDLKERRDAFLQTFFRRGAALTDELLGENKRLREQLATLDEENALLKTHLASDHAMRDLLTKIKELEREKARLLSAVHQQEAMTDRHANRFSEIELELESFANLHVASFQLHASLQAPTVMRNVKELLLQLVGARALAVYFLDEEKKRLVPIATEGVESGAPAIGLEDGNGTDEIAAVVQRAFLTGVPHIASGDVTSSPAACIPMRLEGRVIGTIVVYALLEQKRAFVAVDRELFKLLAAHAGGALVAAYSFVKADGRLPKPEALRAMCA